MLIWCDVETTGLDPRSGALLEVALVATDNELNELEAKSWVLPFNKATAVADGMKIDDFVLDMHTKNGLWDECAVRDFAIGGPYPVTVVPEMIAFCRKYTEPKSVPLAGSTIAFDRSWLEVHAPDLAAHFSHRNLDVSVFTEIAARWYPEAHAARPKSAGHRALPDIRVSLELARYWRSTVLR